MASLVEEAKKRRLEGNKKGAESRHSGLGSAEPRPETNKRTNEVIAGMAGTSKKTPFSERFGISFISTLFLQIQTLAPH
jgi:hypothetical protein